MMAIIILTVVAFIFSLILVFLDGKVNNNDLKDEYLKLLPGYNCGSCGFGSCKGMSEAMLKDPLNYKKCRPMRGEVLAKMEAYLKEKGQI